eukprot:CAMPEP_0117555852 /NCGR_PEP_ID=MMETSP0784-20121206/51493_1 /TAXON_ID=39447 /ORGANISM="" /LENGTH=194 /DNA_ID=CAMNT_0005353081 /DNA_START=84 /DNA_END=668 /DNA_ORIENTATION=+
MPRGRGIVRLVGLVLLGVANFRATLDFVATARWQRRVPDVFAASEGPQKYESGKVNVGVEINDDAPPPPLPTLECDTSCMGAIYDCLLDGCSVDALMKLDKELADDEHEVAESIAELRNQQKLSYSEENAGTLAWLDNFLSRSGSLRAQLKELTKIEDKDFVQQIVKAASIAFGGGRPNDYPKVGVASYSESPP